MSLVLHALAGMHTVMCASSLYSNVLESQEMRGNISHPKQKRTSLLDIILNDILFYKAKIELKQYVGVTKLSNHPVELFCRVGGILQESNYSFCTII